MIIAACAIAPTEFGLPPSNMKGAFGNEGALRFYLGCGWPDAGFLSQQRQHLFHQCVRSDPMFLAQNWDAAVFDELIGPSDANDRGVDHLRMQMLHYRTAETVVQNVIFDRANDFDATGEKFERARIHWFDP